jgi:hypothetical protein
MDHAVPHVLTTRREVEPTLSRVGARSSEQTRDRQFPGIAERGGERARRHVPAFPGALRIAGNVHEHRDRRTRDDLDHELGGQRRKGAPPALLPRAHEDPGTLVVDDRRPRSCERQSPSGAFGAPARRPRAGRAAALADRWPQPGQPSAARLAEIRAGSAADRATGGQESLEEAHGATVEPTGSRLRADIDPKRPPRPPTRLRRLVGPQRAFGRAPA